MVEPNCLQQDFMRLEEHLSSTLSERGRMFVSACLWHSLFFWTNTCSERVGGSGKCLDGTLGINKSNTTQARPGAGSVVTGGKEEQGLSILR